MTSSTTPHFLVTNNELLLSLNGVSNETTPSSPAPTSFSTYKEAEAAADKIYAADVASGFAPDSF
jgi:hypothetical protein